MSLLARPWQPAVAVAAGFVPDGATAYAYDYGGQACRVVLVGYRRKAKSPHSAKLMDAGDKEWIRVNEVDVVLHDVLKAGRQDPKYGAPYGVTTSAA